MAFTERFPVSCCTFRDRHRLFLDFRLCMLCRLTSRLPRRPLSAAPLTWGARAFCATPRVLHNDAHNHGAKFPNFNNPSEAYQVGVVPACFPFFALFLPPQGDVGPLASTNPCMPWVLPRPGATLPFHH